MSEVVQVRKKQKTTASRPTRTIQAFEEEFVIDEGDYLEMEGFARQYQESPAVDFLSIDEAVVAVIEGPGCYEHDDIVGVNAQHRITAAYIGKWHTGPLHLDSLYRIDMLRTLHIVELDVDSIPDCFDRLQNLERLHLINMTRLQRLPPSVCSLQNLRALWCESCPRLQSLPENMGNLANLTDLLTHNTPLQKLPKSIGRLHRLAELHADFSGIGTLPKSVASLKLSELDTGDADVRCHLNLRSLRGLRTLRTTLGSLPKFPTLDFTNLQLLTMRTGASGDFSSLIRINAPNLIYLTIYEAPQLDTETFELLATQWFPHLHSVEALDLSRCKIEEISLVAIKALADMKIEELVISENPILCGDPEAVEKRLLSIVQQCQSVTKFTYRHKDLPFNRHDSDETESEAVRVAVLLNKGRLRVLGGQSICKNLWPSIFENAKKAFRSFKASRNIITEEDAIFLLLQKRAASDLFQ